MNIKIALEKYEDYMRNSKRRNSLTVRNYKRYIEKYIELCGLENVSGITAESIEDFKKKYLATGVSTKTVNFHLIGIKMFLKFLVKNDIPSLAPEKIEMFSKAPDKPIELIGTDELKNFLNHRLDPFSDLLVNLLFTTGLRISELNSLTVEGFSNCSFRVIGKGSKERLVFVSENVCKMLKSYLAANGIKKGPIFLNRWGEKVSITYLQSVLRVRCDKLSTSKKVTPHTLRHLFATNMLSNGADVRSIQELLGHSSPAMTQRYTHITNEQLKGTFNKYSVIK